jgi:hypothetical protein
MALQLFDRVLVTATANTTVSFTLGSAVAGYQSFSVMTNGDTTYYGASDGTNWEVGLGTYTSSGPTLTRTTILSSSNSGSAVTFSGTPNVWIDYPAGKSVYEDASNNVTLPGTLASTGITTPSVTATTNDLTLSAISTGNLNLNTAGGTQFQIANTASTTNYLATTGSNGGTPALYSAGASGNIGTNIVSKGTGSVAFYTNGGVAQQVVSHTASAVNYVQVTGSSTGNQTVISVQGSDANVPLAIAAKGTGTINLQQTTSIGRSATNWLAINGSSASGNAVQANIFGADTNVSLTLQPKGTGAIDLAAGSSGVNISNGGTVTAITRTAGGGAYTSVPALAISAPTTAGGVQATATAQVVINNVVSITNGGTGYTVGNVLTVVGGTFPVQSSQLTVATVSAGVITGVTITRFGTYSATPTNPVSVTGGSGSGATFTLDYAVQSGTFTITNAGLGYIEQPTVTFSGGGGSGASAFASVGAVTTFRTLHTEMQFHTAGGVGFEVQTYGAGTSTSRFCTFASSSGNPAILESRGAAANISAAFSSKGTSALQFYTNSLSLGTGSEQLRVAHTASAVNYVQVTGSATTGSVVISSQGSDTNVGLQLRSKGTGDINLMTAGGTNQVVVRNVASAVNYLSLRGSAAGNMVPIQVEGTDTDIDLALTPKGAGAVRFGTYTGTILTPTGFITIKDSGGTTRRLLVG